jgi:hypothetical protein
MSDLLEELTATTTDPHLVVTKVRQRLSVSKRKEQTFDMESYNPKNLNEVDIKEQHQVKISNLPRRRGAIPSLPSFMAWCSVEAQV